MSLATGFGSLNHLQFQTPNSGKQYVAPHHRSLRIEACSRVPIPQTGDARAKPIIPIRSKIREFRLFNSGELDRVSSARDDDDDNDDETSEGFLEAIEELERMAREPSDILEAMNGRLSARELQLVLLHFAQDGRDSWCALEVFEWLQRENRVDEETMELMVSIMCGWVKKMIEDENDVRDVVDLLIEMDCVGLKPNFSMVEKAISVYWDLGKKVNAIGFVEEVLRRRISLLEDGANDWQKAGPAGYLAWKMLEEGNYRGAVKLVIHLKESGLNPEIYSYIVAMTAAVKELNEIGKALEKLVVFSREGLIEGLDIENINAVESYQSEVLEEGVQVGNWLFKEEGAEPLIRGFVHEKLLSMYICTSRGVEAEKQIWEMKFIGKHVERYLYNIVLSICAYQGEPLQVSRLLTALEVANSSGSDKKKTYTGLMRAYIRARNFKDASKIMMKMLDLGLIPHRVEMGAVVQGLMLEIQKPGITETYLALCKRLSDAELIEPCLIYIYIKSYRLWIVEML